MSRRTRCQCCEELKDDVIRGLCGVSDRQRILVWFSCGAASAVAAKIAVLRYGSDPAYDVDICYCDTSADEHEDNARFMADVERWTGRPVTRLRHPKYRSVNDAVLGERFIVGPFGAACTRVLKRELREAYQCPGDWHVFGLTADEAGRVADFEKYHPDLICRWLLVQGGITKEACYHVLSSHGIALPAMYTLGYNNNNCVGCWKGGKGYWNKVRRDFPAVFADRARVQREIGALIGGGKGKGFYLDELDPGAGRDVPEPPIECGIFCGHYAALVDLSVSAAPAVARPQRAAGRAGVQGVGEAGQSSWDSVGAVDPSQVGTKRGAD